MTLKIFLNGMTWSVIESNYRYRRWRKLFLSLPWRTAPPTANYCSSVWIALVTCSLYLSSS